MSKINELYNTLKKANLNPEWIEDDNGDPTEEICVTINGAEYEISESAAPLMFGVKAEIPFEEPEYYALDAEGVMNLLRQ